MTAVLIVEDSQPLRESLRLILERHGFEVTLASLAADARQAVRQHHYDVAVIDVSLPDMSGLDLVKELRQSDVDCPVVVCSGLPQAEGVLAASGAERFLMKPFVVDELVDLIELLLELHDES